MRFMLQHVDSLPKPDYTPPPAAALPDYSTQANSPVPIYCTPCGPARGGGFSPDVGVILCQDGMFSKKHVEDTLAHELVHEWDHRRFEVDWKDLRMVACSEASQSPSLTKDLLSKLTLACAIPELRFAQRPCRVTADGAGNYAAATLTSQSSIRCGGDECLHIKVRADEAMCCL